MSHLSLHPNSEGKRSSKEKGGQLQECISAPPNSPKSVSSHDYRGSMSALGDAESDWETTRLGVASRSPKGRRGNVDTQLTHLSARCNERCNEHCVRAWLYSQHKAVDLECDCECMATGWERSRVGAKLLLRPPHPISQTPETPCTHTQHAALTHAHAS